MASLETGLAINTRFCYVENWKTLDFENHKKRIIKKGIAKILTAPELFILVRKNTSFVVSIYFLTILGSTLKK